MIYYNYHKHDHKGNIRSLDVVTKLEDYCIRAKELGHNAIFTTNHGMQGDIFEATTLANQYGLKLIVGCECYYVKDRHEKDRTNNHLVVIALNNNGVKQLNKMISIANEDGYYYKPRVDYELIMNLNPNDFVITSACVAGILKNKELVLDLFEKFKDNFMIETQNHNEQIQKDWNLLALKYNKEYGIKLIHGNDSHYIKPEDSKYRELFLKAKGIVYENEGQFILDYPSYDTIVERYKKQGILNDEQIESCLKNTLIFDKSEKIDLINDDIKLPSIVKNPNKELKKIVAKSWSTIKNTIPKDKIKTYEDAIKYEVDIVEKTHMEDYFIIDNKIAKLAQEKYGAKLTNTGRGSAPSFYINKLLGLTDIDRLNSPCTLFPTRFMSVERILGARSLPDIDLNTSDNSKFIQATKDLLGEKNCEWMLAWKPLQEASGFRLYCKSIDLKVNEYDEIAKDLDKYREDEKWKTIIEESKHFIGVIESVSPSPCSMLLYDKPVDEEIGLVKVKDQMCCLLDGYNCDKYKYLKNDYLQVKVWAIIKDVCDMIGIEIPTISELNNLIDDKVWDIYEKGLTCTINQADSDWATSLVKRYKPKSISECSQYVAIIRPGCASLLEDFLDRKPYTTGVKELDDILKDSEHRMIYQESIMKYLIYLGIDEPQSYDIIKKIAKKKFKEKELIELKENLEKGWIKQVGTIEGFEATWTIVQQASRYSFNASHSLSYAIDSIYGAYLKSHYPLEYYSVVLNYYSDDETRTNKLTKELKYFNIEIKNPKFRYSSEKYMPNNQTNTIYKGISSIKYCNEIMGNQLYELRDNKYNSFLDLLIDMNYKVDINLRQINILILLDYFKEFGKTKKLLDTYNLYQTLNGKKQIKKDKINELNLDINILKKYAIKESDKLFKFDEDGMNNVIEYMSNLIEDKEVSLQDKITAEVEYLGYSITKLKHKGFYYVTDIREFKNKKSITRYLTMYDLNTGEQVVYKLSDFRQFSETPIQNNQLIKIVEESKKPKKYKDNDGKWQTKEGEFNLCIESWVSYPVSELVKIK